MPRKARQFSKTKVYHIICKGIDNQDIFYNDIDKRIYLSKIVETKQSINYAIYAYCLMNNHVHLVIGIDNNHLSKLMTSINLRYISYFNKKYMRSGTLFQNRFKSKCVENQKYFLDVCRYVHQNPEKAGICKTQDYKWSSYHEYIGKEKIINKNILLYYFDSNIGKFKDFTLSGRSCLKCDFMEYELKEKFQDDELAEFIIKEFKIQNINDFSKFSKEELKKNIAILNDIEYTNLSQIARVTRINRWILKGFLKK